MILLAHNVEITSEAEGRILHINLSGKLTKEDYDYFIPEIENAIRQHGRVRLLFDVVGFHGWTLRGLFEDAKFGISHHRDIERLAFVGDQKWEETMATLCKRFTKADVRCFRISAIDDARDWIRES